MVKHYLRVTSLGISRDQWESWRQTTSLSLCVLGYKHTGNTGQTCIGFSLFIHLGSRSWALSLLISKGDRSPPLVSTRMQDLIPHVLWCTLADIAQEAPLATSVARASRVVPDSCDMVPGSRWALITPCLCQGGCCRLRLCTYCGSGLSHFSCSARGHFWSQSGDWELLATIWSLFLELSSKPRNVLKIQDSWVHTETYSNEGLEGFNFFLSFLGLFVWGAPPSP